MSLGMTYDQYWNGDVRATAAFVEANRLKKQQENERLWLQGMYFYEGLCVALSNAFSKKGAKKAEYPNEPYPLYKREQTEAEKEAEAIRERQRAHDYFDRIVQYYKQQKEGREIIEPM